MNDQNRKSQEEAFTETRPVMENDTLPPEENQEEAEQEPRESSEDIAKAVTEAATKFARKIAEYASSQEVSDKSKEIRQSVDQFFDNAKDTFWKGTAMAVGGAEKLGKKAGEWINQPQMKEAFGEFEKTVSRFGCGLGEAFRQVMDKAGYVPKDAAGSSSEGNDLCQNSTDEAPKNDGAVGQEDCICYDTEKNMAVSCIAQNENSEAESEAIEALAQQFSKIVETLYVQIKEKTAQAKEIVENHSDDWEQNAVEKAEELTDRIDECSEEITGKLDKLQEKTEAFQDKAVEWAENFGEKAEAVADQIEQKADELEKQIAPNASQITEGIVKGAKALWQGAGGVLNAIGKGFQEATNAFNEALKYEEPEDSPEAEATDSSESKENSQLEN